MRDHYVYWVSDADDVLLYIGCTKNPERRYQQHMNHSDRRGWFNQFATQWRFRGPLPKQGAYDLEAREIAEHQPVFLIERPDQAGNSINARSWRGWGSPVAGYFHRHGLVYPQVPVTPVLAGY